MLPANNEDDMSYEDCTDDLNRVCADLANAAGDPAILLSNIADDNNFVSKGCLCKGYGNRLPSPERYDRRRSSKPHGAVWRTDGSSRELRLCSECKGCREGSCLCRSIIGLRFSCFPLQIWQASRHASALKSASRRQRQS